MPFEFRHRRKSSSGTNPVVYLGETRDLVALTGDETAVILGELVIMNLDEPPLEGANGLGHVPQPTRESRRRDWSLGALRHPASHLYASIHPVLAQQIEGQEQPTKFILAADAMFALAARQPRTATLLVVNGFETDEQTYLDTYLFRFGQLVNITEAIINKSKNHPRYGADVRQQLDAALTDYPDATILWTAPLTPLELPGYTLQLIGPEIYQGKFPSVTCDGQTAPKMPKAPAVATAVVVALCVGAGGLDAMALSKKRAAYDALTRQNSESPSVALEVLQARADWQREIDAIPADKVIGPAAQLLAAVAKNPEWRVNGVSLATQRGSETATPAVPPSVETSPLTITLSVPLVPNVAPIEQAQPVVAALNEATGMKLIVKQQGLSTTTQDGRLSVTIGTADK